jgi:hypothetical protein
MPNISMHIELQPTYGYYFNGIYFKFSFGLSFSNMRLQPPKNLETRLPLYNHRPSNRIPCTYFQYIN